MPNVRRCWRRQAVVQVQLARLQNAVLLYRVLGGGAGPATVAAR